jgi:hypothetical protein
MNYQTINRATAAALGLILASGLFAVVTVGIKLALPVTAIDADRATVRSKALAEIRAEEDNCLNRPAIIDDKRGIVRLPIETALTLAAQKWSDPAAARADLKSRVEKATAPVKTESFE